MERFDHDDNDDMNKRENKNANHAMQLRWRAHNIRRRVQSSPLDNERAMPSRTTATAGTTEQST